MSITTGMNRTGKDRSPIDKNEATEAARRAAPSSAGGERDASVLRAEYGRAAPPLGSVPPPGTVKGVLRSAAQRIQGKDPTVLLDKLGARLAFERTGSRLYQGLVAKFDGKGGFPGGPTREDLVAMHVEEVRHFEMLCQAMERLGGDPTAMTPAADVQGVASMGLLQVIADPRTSLAQGLEAMLIAELADNDAWVMLIEVAQAFGQDEMVREFNVASVEEQRHLALVRRWLSEHAKFDMAGAVPPAGSADA